MKIDERKMKRLVARAESGDVRAMEEYCSLFHDSEHISGDREVRERLRRYLVAGAKAGDANMLCNLGAEYYSGGVVKQDFAKALHYYELSAAKGCVQAISNLGYCYYYGRSVSVDYEKAFGYFLKAYILEGFCQPEACYKLGDCYRHGRGVAQDPVIARRLYEEAYNCAWRPNVKTFKAVSVGWDRRMLGADAASRLGDCHRLGIGTDVDLKQAAKYYRVAIAGFKRKMQFGDPFAPSLLDLARTHLEEVLHPCKSLREKRPYSQVIEVAGLKYAKNHEEIIARLKIGEKLRLLRDPGNAYDANAIAVMTAKGERFGWLPRAFNAAPAALLDRGVELVAEVIEKVANSDVGMFVTVSVREANRVVREKNE